MYTSFKIDRVKFELPQVNLDTEISFDEGNFKSVSPINIKYLWLLVF